MKCFKTISKYNNHIHNNHRMIRYYSSSSISLSSSSLLSLLSSPLSLSRTANHYHNNNNANANANAINNNQKKHHQCFRCLTTTRTTLQHRPLVMSSLFDGSHADNNSRSIPKNSCQKHFSTNNNNYNSTIDKNSHQLVITDIDEKIGIAKLILNNPPVNSLSLEMCTAIANGIKHIEEYNQNNNNIVRCIVLSSSLSTVFCAGLDITEMFRPKTDRLIEFWTSFQQLYAAVYANKNPNLPPIIAAISGHAPAAGTMLALCCDYRIMVASMNNRQSIPTIGLNEAKLGIVPPKWLSYQYMDTIGIRHAELGIAKGTLYTPQQALNIQLIDEVYDYGDKKETINNDDDNNNRQTAAAAAAGEGKEEFINYIIQNEAIKHWCKIPLNTFNANKQIVREHRIRHFYDNREKDLDFFVNFVTNDQVQNNIGQYLKMIQQKKTKK